MTVYAAVLTYRPQATGRLEVLNRTVAALAREADAVWVVDNGSGEDECLAIKDAIGVAPFTHDDPLHTSGFGTNLQARVLAGAAKPGDICVHSDDDIDWGRGWRRQLARWWRAAPDGVVLTGCHLEPEYPWNGISGRVECGGVSGLLRESTGAGTWTYRAEHWPLIGPIPQRIQGTGDVPACRNLRARGYRIAQLDLAEHLPGDSTWGNTTVRKFGDDVAPVRMILAGEQ